MSRYQQYQVVDPEGVRATLLASSRFLDGNREKVLRLDNGQEMLVGNDLLEPMTDGSFRLRTPLRNLIQSRTDDGGSPVNRTPDARESVDATESVNARGSAVIPAIEERLRINREAVETGRIRLQKRVEESSTVVDEPLYEKSYNIERVPVNRILSDGVVPEPRYDGDVLILPVVEEVLVVEKRLVLREEVRVTPNEREVHDPQTHTLRREHIEVERLS